MLTRTSTQTLIEFLTDTAILTKGKYIPDVSLITPNNPALSLEVSGPTQDEVDNALVKIKEIMERGDQALKELSSANGTKASLESTPTKNGLENDNKPLKMIPSVFIEKVYLAFEPDWVRMAAFNLCGKIKGPKGGSYLKHIASVSNSEVSLRGAGSGHVDLSAKPVSFAEGIEEEPLHLYILAFSEKDMLIAKTLAEDLLETVQHEYTADYIKMMASTDPSYAAYYSHWLQAQQQENKEKV